MSEHVPLLLPKTLAAWGTPAFEAVLKGELEGVEAHRLPLQQGLSHSSYVGDSPFRVIPIRAEAAPGALHLSVGILYTGIIAGCSCADDPTPQDEQTEYCRLDLVIDRESGAVSLSLLEEE